MQRVTRILAGSIAALIAVLAVAFFLLRTPDTDRDAMIAKYSNEASRFVDDGFGGKIHYRDEGNQQGVPLLLIHGANGVLQTWEPLVELLGEHYRLISLDLPSHGLTGPHGNSDYSAEANIAVAAKVLDTVGVEQAYWVGNSMGGWLAWRAGLAVPDQVLGLVLIDASGAQTDEKVTRYLGARLARTSIGQLVMPYITPRALVQSSLEENYANPALITDALVTRYWEALRFPGNRQAAVVRINTDRETEKWRDIGSLTMPVLVLWGEQDSVIPLSHARAFEAKISDSLLITYPDAGHLPMEETPEQVARDINKWVSGLVAAEQ